MIKVTFTNSIACYEAYSIIDNDFFAYDNGLGIIFDLEDVLKVEKQVKDLTLEELLSKNIIVNQYEDNSGMVCFKIYDISGRKYSLDDYVDITSIVKGEE